MARTFARVYTQRIGEDGSLTWYLHTSGSKATQVSAGGPAAKACDGEDLASELVPRSWERGLLTLDNESEGTAPEEPLNQQEMQQQVFRQTQSTTAVQGIAHIQNQTQEAQQGQVLQQATATEDSLALPKPGALTTAQTRPAAVLGDGEAEPRAEELGSKANSGPAEPLSLVQSSVDVCSDKHLHGSAAPDANHESGAGSKHDPSGIVQGRRPLTSSQADSGDNTLKSVPSASTPFQGQGRCPGVTRRHCGHTGRCPKAHMPEAELLRVADARNPPSPAFTLLQKKRSLRSAEYDAEVDEAFADWEASSERLREAPRPSPLLVSSLAGIAEVRQAAFSAYDGPVDPPCDQPQPSILPEVPMQQPPKASTPVADSVAGPAQNERQQLTSRVAAAGSRPLANPWGKQTKKPQPSAEKASTAGEDVVRPHPQSHAPSTKPSNAPQFSRSISQDGGTHEDPRSRGQKEDDQRHKKGRGAVPASISWRSVVPTVQVSLPMTAAPDAGAASPGAGAAAGASQEPSQMPPHARAEPSSSRPLGNPWAKKRQAPAPRAKERTGGEQPHTHHSRPPTLNASERRSGSPGRTSRDLPAKRPRSRSVSEDGGSNHEDPQSRKLRDSNASKAAGSEPGLASTSWRSVVPTVRASQPLVTGADPTASPEARPANTAVTRQDQPQLSRTRPAAPSLKPLANPWAKQRQVGTQSAATGQLPSPSGSSHSALSPSKARPLELSRSVSEDRGAQGHVGEPESGSALQHNAQGFRRPSVSTPLPMESGSDSARSPGAVAHVSPSGSQAHRDQALCPSPRAVSHSPVALGNPWAKRVNNPQQGAAFAAQDPRLGVVDPRIGFVQPHQPQPPPSRGPEQAALPDAQSRSARPTEASHPRPAAPLASAPSGPPPRSTAAPTPSVADGMFLPREPVELSLPRRGASVNFRGLHQEDPKPQLGVADKDGGGPDMPPLPDSASQHYADLDGLFGSPEASGEDSDDNGPRDESANDNLCAICDDGGELLMCENICMRSFCTKTQCLDVLQIPSDLLDALLQSNVPFTCPNCFSDIHQCFVCGKLGKYPDEVRQCIEYRCGRFFHRSCLEKVGALVPGVAGDDLWESRTFKCPQHRCKAGIDCKCIRSKDEPLIPCRRCPKAYHRSCLPNLICHSDPKRVWISGEDNTDQSLFYCDRHVIVPGEDIPRRPAHHIFFTRKMQRKWLYHLADKFKHRLPSCRELCRKYLKAQKMRETGMAIDSDSESDEDVMLGDRLQSQKSRVNENDADLSDDETFASRLAKRRRPDSAAASVTRDFSSSPRIARREATAAAGASGLVHRLAGAAEGHRRPSLPSPHQQGSAASLAYPILPPPPPPARRKEVQHVGLDWVAALTETGHPTSEEARKRHQRRELLENLYQEAEEEITPYDVERSIVKIKPYIRSSSSSSNKVVPKARIKVMQTQVDLMIQDKQETQQPQFPHPGMVKEVSYHLMKLNQMLNPYLHAQRFTSYGRHFTNSDRLRFVVGIISPLMRMNDTVVDFSCGANEWAPMLRREAMEHYTKTIHVIAYDIVTPKCMEGFRKKSWFDVEPVELPSPENLVIGLNPPFGMQSAFAKMWTQKAASFRPRIIVLVVPDNVPDPEGYECLYSNSTYFASSCFYVPGMQGMPSWNRLPPKLAILVRTDYCMSDEVVSWKEEIGSLEEAALHAAQAGLGGNL